MTWRCTVACKLYARRTRLIAHVGSHICLVTMKSKELMLLQALTDGYCTDDQSLDARSIVK